MVSCKKLIYENKIQLGTIYIRHLGHILWHTLSAFGDKVEGKDSTSRDPGFGAEVAYLQRWVSEELSDPPDKRRAGAGS